MAAVHAIAVAKPERRMIPTNRLVHFQFIIPPVANLTTDTLAGNTTIKKTSGRLGGKVCHFGRLADQRLQLVAEGFGWLVSLVV